MTTKAPVKASAICGEENTYWKPTRYICVGSTAFGSGTKCSMARNGQERSGQQLQHAGNDPARTGRQTGHPPGRLSLRRAARRQKSQEIDLLADLRDQREHHRRGGAKQDEIERAGLRRRPALRNSSSRSNDALSAVAMKTNGMRCSTIHIGCVQDWKRLMKVMPCVTRGMTIKRTDARSR